jgi:hypothetical protein
MKKYTWGELIERCTKELAESTAGYKKLAEQTAAFSHYSAWRAFCDHFAEPSTVLYSKTSPKKNRFASRWEKPVGYLKD